MTTTPDLVRNRLQEALEPEHLEIVDDSHHHEGHQGDRAHGGAHLTVTIVSSRFDGLSLVERHRLVYGAVNDLLKQEIHALSMETHAPSEWSARST